MKLSEVVFAEATHGLDPTEVVLGVVADPESSKRPKRSWTRLTADPPGECQQADHTHYCLIDDHDVRIIDAATGELLRELTIDPTPGYQPMGKPRNPHKHQNSRT